MSTGDGSPYPSMSHVVATPRPGREAPGRASARWLLRLKGLSYYASTDAAERRDLRWDFLRGFCVFAMVIDHLGGDSWLYAITGGNRFYVSAAEGFIFISGFVMGQAYLRKMQRSSITQAMTDALSRARTLYVATATLSVIFSALYLYTDVALWTGRDFGLGIESFDEVVIGAFTLHFTYHGTDILAMYALLLLLSPLTLLLLSTGRWAWVLAPSLLWWLAFQIYPEEASFPWYIRHGENFPVGAWQVLFITGQVLGFHRADIAAFLHRWTHLRVVLAGLGIAAALALVSLFWASESPGSVPAQLPFPFFDVTPDVLNESFFKVTLRPWRLFAFASVGIAAFTASTYLWLPLRRVFGWLLLPLGQRALYSYIVHFFLILLVYNLSPLIATYAPDYPEEVVNPLVQIAVVLLLWAMVKRRVLFGIVPN